LDVIQPGEIAVKRSNGQGTGFSRNLEYETIREFDRWPPAIVIQGRSHNIRILKAQLPVIEQHLNVRCDLRPGQIIDGTQDPKRLGISAWWMSEELKRPARRTTTPSSLSCHSSTDPGPMLSFLRTSAGTEI
jgi:hypothetical protein